MDLMDICPHSKSAKWILSNDPGPRTRKGVAPSQGRCPASSFMLRFEATGAVPSSGSHDLWGPLVTKTGLYRYVPAKPASSPATPPLAAEGATANPAACSDNGSGSRLGCVQSDSESCGEEPVHGYSALARRRKKR
jgi:hypothetical protein